jgi:hypothetical protein
MILVDSSSGWCRPLPARCYIDELNHAEGIHAAAIQGRQGGDSSTSRPEALHRLRRGCSKPLCHKWCRGGPWLRVFAGKGLPSNKSSFLGGEWRTLASGGGGAQGPHCKIYFCSRVLFVKRKPLSLDRRSPRATIVRIFLHSVSATCLLMESWTPTFVQKKLVIYGVGEGFQKSAFFVSMRITTNY